MSAAAQSSSNFNSWDENETLKLYDTKNNSFVESRTYHQEQLSQDLELLYCNKDYADVVITCGDRKFECHKVILTSRSPVFKSMFGAGMKEGCTGRVEIKDMNPEVLENLLKYIYTSDAPDIDAVAKELFVAADQYQLIKLKQLCEEKLSSTIDVDNCIDLLVLGELHQASSLKEAALKFVAQNMEEIDSEVWKKTEIAYPNFSDEVDEMMKMYPKVKMVKLVRNMEAVKDTHKELLNVISSTRRYCKN